MLNGEEDTRRRSGDALDRIANKRLSSFTKLPVQCVRSILPVVRRQFELEERLTTQYTNTLYACICKRVCVHCDC